MWKPALVLTALLWLVSAQSLSFHLLLCPLYFAILLSFIQSLKPLLLSQSWTQLVSQSSFPKSHFTLLFCCVFESTTYILLFASILAFSEDQGQGTLHASKLYLLGALLSHLCETLLSSENGFSSGYFLYSSSALSNLLMTATIACQGGVCYTLYISTFTSVLGAFGVTVIDMVDILRPVQLVLLGVFLVSLYKAGKTCFYLPLWVGGVGAGLIVASLYVQDLVQDGSEMKQSVGVKMIEGYGVFAGNLVVVGSSLWNLRRQGVMGI